MTRARIASCAFLASFGIGAAQVKPAEVDTAAARAQRLERDQAALTASLAAVEAFGRGDEFLTAARQLLERAEGGKWARIGDGWLPAITLERYVGWNAPADGRTLPVACDLELEGHPFAAIVDLDRQLRLHGIDFLFVTFPCRVQLHPETVGAPGLTGSSDGFHGMVAAQTRFLQALSKAGVEVVDLAPLFVAQRHIEGRPEDLLYLRANMHWTPRGAELAAKAVAARLREFAWFTPGPAVEGREFEVRPFEYETNEQYSEPPEGAAPERVSGHQVRPLGAAAPNKSRDGPIVLLGDSFVEFHGAVNASFARHLYAATGYSIDVIAPKGGGEYACRDALRRRGDALRGKKVVIWLLQEANLRPSNQFRTVDLFE